MSANKRYYWLKLPKDFFKRHDIKIIEGMPGGREYLLIYLKLLCESITHDGALRFSDELHYTHEMLATVLGEDVKKLKRALGVLKKLNLVVEESDKTIFLPEVPNMTGSETKSAARVRRHRQKKVLQSSADETESNALVTQRKSKEKEQDKDIDKDTEPDDDNGAQEELNSVDVHRLTTVFGNYSKHTAREYLKLKKHYDDEILHAAVEKTWVLGGKTIEYTKKILEEV